jgi:hypothetical protein
MWCWGLGATGFSQFGVEGIGYVDFKEKRSLLWMGNSEELEGEFGSKK